MKHKPWVTCAITTRDLYVCIYEFIYDFIYESLYMSIYINELIYIWYILFIIYI